MTLNLRMPDTNELKPKITVFGVGGAGGNAVNNMIEKALEGADFIVANTDSQALHQSKAVNKIQLGEALTQGLGAGARPEVGAGAAEESIETIVDHLAGSNMCFITAGMGGGTGTGAAPIIAKAARELGVLTVGVVTKPFQFEGARRMRQAEEGIEALQKVVDTLIIIPNQNLFRLATEKTTFAEAFSMADDVLYQGVKGVTDLMVRPGLINLDFADVRAVMDEMGKAMMGTGEAEGDDRAIKAAEKAIANPLLDEISLRGARGVLINITGGHDLSLFELDEAANRIREEVDPDANIIVGSTLDPSMEGLMRISVVATGIDAVQKEIVDPKPANKRSLREEMRSVEAEKPAQEKALETTARDVFAARVEPVAEVRQPDLGLFDEELHGGSGEQVKQDVVAEASEEMFERNQPTEAAQAPQPLPERAPSVLAQSQPPRNERRAGEPSPETLARLRAAVENAPSYAPQPQQKSASTLHSDGAAPVPAPHPHSEKGRGFGLGTLISRMSGAQDARSEGDPQAPASGLSAQRTGYAPRQHGSAAPDVDRQMDEVQIPAFLRRQAN